MTLPLLPSLDSRKARNLKMVVPTDVEFSHVQIKCERRKSSFKIPKAVHPSYDSKNEAGLSNWVGVFYHLPKTGTVKRLSREKS